MTQATTMRDFRYLIPDAFTFLVGKLCYMLAMHTPLWRWNAFMLVAFNYAYWDDPWVVECRWRDRGFDVTHLEKTHAN